MEIYYYTTQSGKNPISDYINSLTVKEQVDAYSVLQNLQENQIDKVKFKHWAKKIYEIYFYKDNRIFYVTIDNNCIYLLHACRKQKNKTEKIDKNTVIQRAKILGKELGKTFI